MAACVWCEQEMTTAASCRAEVLHLHGKPIRMIRWGHERGWRGASERCGDCGVEPDGFHHLGCDLQECPRCGRQMLSCGCRFDEDPPEDDDPLDGDLFDEEGDDA